uniref:Transposase n=1 Tax=Steinernema glaseri TaxID=37863 RepID=A0A1I8A4M8_9BILA
MISERINGSGYLGIDLHITATWWAYASEGLEFEKEKIAKKLISSSVFLLVYIFLSLTRICLTLTFDVSKRHWLVVESWVKEILKNNLKTNRNVWKSMWFALNRMMLHTK